MIYGQGLQARAIYVDTGARRFAAGEVYIRNNTLTARVQTTETSYGYCEAVAIYGVKVEVSRNTIRCSAQIAQEGSGYSLTGLKLAGAIATADVFNNVVVADPEIYSTGKALYVDGVTSGELAIRNNTFVALAQHTGNSASGAEVRPGSGTTIAFENNIIDVEGATGNTVYGMDAAPGGGGRSLFGDSSMAVIDTLRNNAIRACTQGSTSMMLINDYQTAAEINGDDAVGKVRSGNIGGQCAFTMGFADFDAGDFHLTATMGGPKGAGLDGAMANWGFSDDRDGMVRTAPWSIGAYR